MNKNPNRNKDLNTIASFLISIVHWVSLVFFAALYNILGFLVLAPISWLKDKGSRNTIHLGAVWWAKSLIACTPIWKLNVQGVEHISPDKTYLVVANHQSMIDILVVAAGLPIPFKFLAKKELFKFPFVGWHMSLSGYIPVDRDRKDSRRRALLAIEEKLRKDINVLFFPEGTRSKDGEIQAFKPAAFKMAKEAGVEILPVVIDGSGEALPKRSMLLKKSSDFILSVGKPVSLHGCADGDISSAISEIRDEMIQRLQGLREA